MCDNLEATGSGMPQEITHEMAVHMLYGGRQPDTRACIKLVELGLMKFTGNQHNDRWSWVQDTLDRITTENILMYYSRLNKKEEKYGNVLL